MAALNFPDTPAVGELYGSAGTVWRWDGARWASTAGASGARGALGYQSMTTSTAVVSTTTVISALGVNNVVIPAGRRIKVTLSYRNIAGTPGATGGFTSITANGVTICEQAVRWDPVGGANGGVCEGVFVSVGGSYNFGCFLIPSAGQTMQMQATATGPCFLMVEDITYEAGSGGPGVPTPGASVATVVAAEQITGAGQYADLATVGPSVTLVTGKTAELLITAQMRRVSGSANVYTNIQVSGATTLAAPTPASNMSGTVNNSAAGLVTAATTLVWPAVRCVIGNLTPGSNTFTVKYGAVAGSVGEFANRTLQVQRID